MMMKKKQKKGLALPLPRELLMEILLKVPTRPLLRFSCVSKSWHNLIMQDDYFRDLHSQPTPHDFNPTYLFFYHQEILVKGMIPCNQSLNIGMSLPNSRIHNIINLHRDPSVVKPPIGFYASGYLRKHNDELFPYIFETTCNGLLCLVPSFDRRNDPVLLCNPMTAEYLKLPPLNINNTEHYSVGLGYAPFSHQYKVVCVMKSIMYVHTVGSDRSTWREIQMKEQNQNYFYFYPFYNNILYLDGKIYYLVRKRLSETSFGERLTMLVFDVESEKVTLADHTEFPILSKNCLLVNLPSCGGKGVSLLNMKQQKSTSTSVVDVWVLREDGKWDMQHQIKFPHNQSTSTKTRMVSAWELVDGDVLIFLSDNFMVRYDRNTKITTATEQLPVIKLPFCFSISSPLN